MIKSRFGKLIEKLSILKNNADNNRPYVICSALVSLYFSILIYLTVFDTLNYIVALPFIWGIIWYILLSCRNHLSNITLIAPEYKINISHVKLFIIFLLIVFCGQLLYWFAYYPGGFNLDAYGQWDQVHGYIHLNNWHPVITTGFYWVLTRIYDSFSFCIFTQLVLFSISVSCLLLTLYKMGVKISLLLITSFYIALNPAIGMNNVCLYKDVLFSISIIWLIIFLLEICNSNGVWMKSIHHKIYMIIVLILVTLIRHNGIFFIAPVLLMLIVFYKKYVKQILEVIFMTLICLVIIQGPVFSALTIEQHSNFVGEMIGVPMSIMANVFVSDPEKTPSDVREFLLSIASEEEWHDNYELGEWDSCKWTFGGTELLKNESLNKIMSLTLSSFLASPNAAYQSIRENTRVVWQVFGYCEWYTWIYIEDNGYGIVLRPNDICMRVTDYILEYSLTLSGTFSCWNIGVANMLLALVMLLQIARGVYYKIILCVPIITYNLLTMMLLCGPSHRYFYFTSVLFIPVMLYFLLDEKSNMENI